VIDLMLTFEQSLFKLAASAILLPMRVIISLTTKGGGHDGGIYRAQTKKLRPKGIDFALRHRCGRSGTWKFHNTKGGKGQSLR
jgi:hypothetical protein